MFNVTLSTADDVESLPQVLGSSSQIAQLHNQPRNNIRIIASPSRPPVQMDDVKVALKDEFNLQVDVQRMGSVGAKTVYIILGQADIYLNTSGFYEWDLAAPLGVAHHYGLDVFLPSGAPFLFNQIDVSLGGALISRPEFVPTILKSLA
jgi:3'(2'), 5'-bisphosphate nucleotidase